VYSTDNWATVKESVANLVGPACAYVDISTADMKEGMILFTLAWPGEGSPDKWLGRNIEVVVTP
jgi:hypothetical protein